MATTKSQTRPGNGIKSAAKTAATRSVARTTQAKPEMLSNPARSGSPETQAQALLKSVQQLVASKYKVKLQMRDKRVSTKVGHAAREKLGLDLAAQVKKAGKQFNWNDWNNKIFPKLFGKPDALKYEPDVIARVMSLIYDTVSPEPEQGVQDLVEFNRASLERRNAFQQSEDDDEDDLDDELEDDLDDILDEDEDELGDDLNDNDEDEFDDEFDEEEE
jgi:hypothetical protein